MEGGATVRIQTHVLEMLEVIFFVADPMDHKPLLSTNDLYCAAMEGGATYMPFFGRGLFIIRAGRKIHLLHFQRSPVNSSGPAVDAY